MDAGFLNEETVKRWSSHYLGGFSNNLMLIWACESGSWVA
jgi:hypothetical protein